MSTKEQLLQLLEENKGRFLSGEEIAADLCVSRTSVWKAVKSLKEAGYQIESVTNRGYCLSEETDVLSGTGIVKYLDPALGLRNPRVYKEVDSTNNILLKDASEGAPEGSIVVASSQTGGKGRRGRAFFSPEDTGVYLSILLRPSEVEASVAASITTMAAVAVCEAIEKVSGQRAGIKWVNDIFVNGLKVCGILTEASFDVESGHIAHAVLGIGINVYEPAGGFPEDIKNVAGAVFAKSVSDGKNRLAAEVINSFFRYYFGKATCDYRDGYKDRCFVLGQEINVMSRDGQRKALAIDLDRECHLIVEYPDGGRQTLSSGEISIRLK